MRNQKQTDLQSFPAKKQLFYVLALLFCFGKGFAPEFTLFCLDQESHETPMSMRSHLLKSIAKFASVKLYKAFEDLKYFWNFRVYRKRFYTKATLEKRL